MTIYCTCPTNYSKVTPYRMGEPKKGQFLSSNSNSDRSIFEWTNSQNGATNAIQYLNLATFMVHLVYMKNIMLHFLTLQPWKKHEKDQPNRGKHPPFSAWKPPLSHASSAFLTTTAPTSRHFKRAAEGTFYLGVVRSCGTPMKRHKQFSEIGMVYRYDVHVDSCLIYINIERHLKKS